MNTPSDKDIPNGAHIEAIMDKLSEVDTTITLAEVLERPELETVQSDVLITQRVRERLLRARSQDIQEIYFYRATRQIRINGQQGAIYPPRTQDGISRQSG